ncbi:hypothetical protein BDV97DRAFT_83843 [Delphinella strobiligena]|nr:hypothetical protein BDV97DRAFT_83843 [Delphinella strobiligena]
MKASTQAMLASATVGLSSAAAIDKRGANTCACSAAATMTFGAGETDAWTSTWGATWGADGTSTWASGGAYTTASSWGTQYYSVLTSSVFPIGAQSTAPAASATPSKDDVSPVATSSISLPAALASATGISTLSIVPSGAAGAAGGAIASATQDVAAVASASSTSTASGSTGGSSSGLNIDIWTEILQLNVSVNSHLLSINATLGGISGGSASQTVITSVESELKQVVSLLTSAKSSCNGGMLASGHTEEEFGNLLAELLLEIEFTVSYAVTILGHDVLATVIATLETVVTGLVTVLEVIIPDLLTIVGNVLQAVLGAVSGLLQETHVFCVLGGVLGLVGNVLNTLTTIL